VCVRFGIPIVCPVVCLGFVGAPRLHDEPVSLGPHPMAASPARGSHDRWTARPRLGCACSRGSGSVAPGGQASRGDVPHKRAGQRLAEVGRQGRIRDLAQDHPDRKATSSAAPVLGHPARIPLGSIEPFHVAEAAGTRPRGRDDLMGGTDSRAVSDRSIPQWSASCTSSFPTKHRGRNMGQPSPHGPASGPAAMNTPLLLGHCKAKSTSPLGWLGEVSARWNRAVGWDTAVTSQQMSRRGTPDISERLQDLGGCVASAGMPGERTQPIMESKNLWGDDTTLRLTSPITF